VADADPVLIDVHGVSDRDGIDPTQAHGPIAGHGDRDRHGAVDLAALVAELAALVGWHATEPSAGSAQAWSRRPMATIPDSACVASAMTVTLARLAACGAAPQHLALPSWSRAQV
jgi:hypothetical protein